MSTTSLPQIFISYPIEDEVYAKDLYKKLSEAGFKPWMFSEDLMPGESTLSGPEKALRQSDFFLAVITQATTSRPGYFVNEYRIAKEIWKERGEGIFIIPVRIERCEVPQTLKEFQTVDIFTGGGWDKLLNVLHSAVGAPLEPPTIPDELLRSCLEKRCVLYAGSGFSAPAGYPTWTQFLRQLLDWAWKYQIIDPLLIGSLARSVDSGDTRLVADSMVTRIINANKVALFNDYLKQVFLNPYLALPNTHKQIPKIGFSALVTPNFDNLLEDSVLNGSSFTYRDTEQLLEKLNKRDFFILKMFGRLQEPDSILAAPYQFEDMLSTNRAFVNLMESLFVSRSFLFAGVSLDGIFSILDAIKVPLSNTQHYALVAVSGRAWETRAELLEKRFGVKVLPFRVSATFSEVANFFADLAEKVRAKSVQRKVARSKTSVQGEVRSTWLSKLQLTNIGPFDSLELELDSKWNILLGDNGVGKSSILRAIALGLSGIDAQPYADRLLRVGQTSGRIVLSTNKGNEYITDLLRTSTSVEVRQVPGRPLETEGWLALGFPPIRTVSWLRPTAPQLETTRVRPTPDDLIPILSGDPDPRLDKIKQVLINMDYLIKSSKNAKERTWGKKLQNDYFGVVTQLTGDLKVEYKGIDTERRSILVTTDDGEVPIEMLSQGTVSLLGWVGSLVQRLYEVFDQSRRPLDNYALVLIDEIDAHMHPQWQQTLVSGLNKQFPNVQFCASTHSPLIVGGMPVEQVIGFARDEDGRVMHLKDIPKDMTMGRTDQVLTGRLFGLVTTLDTITHAQIKHYQELMGKPSLSPEEQNELEQLEGELDIRIPPPEESLPVRRAEELLESLLYQMVGNDYQDVQKSLLNKAAQLLDEVSADRRTKP